MGKLIFLLTFLISFIGIGQNQVDAKGRKQGPWSKTYPKSKVYEYKGQFKDNKPVGTFTYFYASTKVKAIIKHDESSTRSVAYFYHENGNLMSAGIYRDLKKDSVWMNFLPSGRLSTSETFMNDLLHGKKIIYFVPEDVNDKSRFVSGAFNYENGKLKGEAIEYFDTGVTRSKGSYEMDKKVGVWDYFHPNGKKMIMERYKNGIRHGWQFAYDETGKEVGKSYYYYGQKKEGKELEHLMKQMKAKGISPNG